MRRWWTSAPWDSAALAGTTAGAPRRPSPASGRGASLALALAVGLIDLGGRPAAAQAPPACTPAARSLTGHWTTTETVDGENGSFWRGALRLVQRGDRVVGRWEPPGGQPERLVAGSYANGVLRVAQRGNPALAPAGVEPAASRVWLLTLSADGTILSGRWSEPADGPAARHG
ncbi:MAG TPA: hypothetical protein VNK05_15090, partial [Chloroflexota bacterium]|nr:hypothetical protein [Chloroflexota bacterium]